ncbi:3-oxoacyl-ACP synthase [Lutimonas sp.]|uniref:3-oxoacyl-ACP synthase n=1 Tax=Lutimonas sp. TaxID=1872403 RepID=UPI003D9B2490
MDELKKELLEACTRFVTAKSQNIEKIMQANQLALENESKSSAGDKHETGRAMLHLEMEKASQQLEVVSKMKEVLQRIDLSINSSHARLGSLVTTSQGHYFLSISAGLIAIKDNSYYAISSSSPIGALLLGKSQGDEITLSGKKIELLSIA